MYEIKMFHCGQTSIDDQTLRSVSPASVFCLAYPINHSYPQKRRRNTHLQLQYSNLQFLLMLPEECKHPSFEEFRFQLTQNQISSPCKPLRFNGHSRQSLQYTVSQISIENELEDDVPHFLSHLPSSNLKERQCGYATASTRHTLTSVKNTFQTLHSNTVSCKQHSSLQKIKATLAVCAILFDDQSSDKSYRKKRKSQEKFRLRKAVSVRERKHSQNLQADGNRIAEERSYGQPSKDEVIKNAFKVKTINIESNEIRGKVYLKKLIQNRASIMHISESFHPLETRRMTFRM